MSSAADSAASAVSGGDEAKGTQLTSHEESAATVLTSWTAPIADASAPASGSFGSEPIAATTSNTGASTSGFSFSGPASASNAGGGFSSSSSAGRGSESTEHVSSFRGWGSATESSSASSFRSSGTDSGGFGSGWSTGSSGQSSLFGSAGSGSSSGTSGSGSGSGGGFKFSFNLSPSSTASSSSSASTGLFGSSGGTTHLSSLFASSNTASSSSSAAPTSSDEYGRIWGAIRPLPPRTETGSNSGSSLFGSGTAASSGFSYSGSTGSGSAGGSGFGTGSGGNFSFNLGSSVYVPNTFGDCQFTPQAEPSARAVFSADPQRDAATRELVDAIAADRNCSNESIRKRILSSLMDPAQRELICWDAPIAPFTSEKLSGSLLLVWLHLTFGLRMMSRPTLTGELVPAGLADALLALVSAGFDCSAVDARGFSIITHLLNDPHDAGHLTFRIALLRALFTANTNGSALKHIRTESQWMTLVTRLVLAQHAGWCGGSSDKAQHIVDVLAVLCAHATDVPILTPAFVQIAKCGLSGAVLPRWFLTLSAAQLESIDLSAVQVSIFDSERLTTLQRISCSVIERVAQWQVEYHKASVEEQQTSFAALTAWLRSTVDSLPLLLATHDYLTLKSAKPPAVGLAECTARFRSALPHLGWWQLSEHVSSTRIEEQNLFMHIAAKEPVMVAVAQTVEIQTIRAAIIERMRELTRQQQEARARARALCRSNPSNQPTLLELPPSPLDPCGLLSAPVSGVADSPEWLLADLTAQLTRSMRQPPITAHTRELLRQLVEAASSLRPIDDSPSDDRTPPFCGVPLDRHPLVQLLHGAERSLPAAAALHELGVTRDAAGHSFTTILMSRGSWPVIKAWLSPEYARHSMLNDWMSERVDSKIRGWTKEAASSWLHNHPLTIQLPLFGPGADDAVAALTPEQRASAEAERAHQSGEIMLGEATHTRFFHMTWGSAKSVEMLAMAVQYWTAVHRPKIVRAVEAHLIPDLATEVMAFLTPDLQRMQPAQAAATVKADSTSAASAPAAARASPSAAAASTSALSASLRALLRRAQTTVIDPADLVSSLAELVNLQAECAEAVEGDRIAQKLADYSIVPPS